MISKQWQLVHGYISPDFHRIETKQHDNPDFAVAERMLKDLFYHRQSCVQAMSDQFAPGASRFWVYWAASVMVLAALGGILVLVSYQPLTTTYDDIRRWRRERRQACLDEEKGFVVRVEPVRQSRSF
ncbi:hypothetical protein F4775DRAFT_590233 [Biscogniauxia sp. FL1348]|nr:hypothetical protein F4775DRAFT_590233 [Biscogniauxia sp. FL1348]